MKRTMPISVRHTTLALSKQGMIEAIITQIIDVLTILLLQESLHIIYHLYTDHTHRHFFKDYDYDL